MLRADLRELGVDQTAALESLRDNKSVFYFVRKQKMEDDSFELSALTDIRSTNYRNHFNTNSGGNGNSLVSR